jgi:hypothetical protein
MKTILKLNFVVFLLIAAASATFAAAYNGNIASGEAANIVSGREVSNVEYRLGVNPAQISQVEFDLDAPAKQVRVMLSTSLGTFFSCQNSAALHWVCATPGVSVASADTLRVVAIGQ